MNKEQKKHLASVFNIVALAQFSMFGYTALMMHPVNGIRLTESSFEFVLLEFLAIAVLGGI